MKKHNSTNPLQNLKQRDQLTRLADFLFEAGMLQRTPRSGFQFLGSGNQDVAQHSFRTAIIGFVLASMAGANQERTALLCLLHDFHEARIGDFNYVNKIYNTTNARLAVEHATHGTGLENVFLGLWDEQEDGDSSEALLARDADQLELILSLVEQRSLGNPYAEKWLEAAQQRLRTAEAKQLADRIIHVDPADWWFLGPDASWWQNKS